MASDDTTLVPVDECSHPSLTTINTVDKREVVYKCDACGKKIAIPQKTLDEDAAGSLAGIIAIVFGPQWGASVIAALACRKSR